MSSTIATQTRDLRVFSQTSSTSSSSTTSSTRRPVKIYSLESLKLVCWDKKCLSSKNPVAKNLYESVEAISYFFSSIFNLSGIDGKGKLPTFNIDWAEDNAAWDCSEAANCSWKFNNKFIDPAIVCHEYTHAIIHEHTNLGGTRESGALHESLADVMAIIFKRFYNDQSWEIVDRDMSKHYDMKSFQHEEKCTEHNDACHVHENSRIPSHAFYAATVLSKNFSKIAHVWFQAMIKMSPTESFKKFAKRTVAIAAKLKVKTVVKKAWLDVGIET